MSDPEVIFRSIAQDLRQVGITVESVPRPWNGGYRDDVQQYGRQALHLLGWMGDYSNPGNFVASFFGRSKREFGFENIALFDAVARADATQDTAARAAAYRQLNRDLMATLLPAVPIAHVAPALVVRSNIHGFVPSPLVDETFNTVAKR